ncbi:MAG: ABC transporter ATP-binding protein, partial [Candidatus Eisenbacteria bacterium]|nr:ABC transporter ATP-binding protein [Candidatus Eisenbacteria bacterium]
MKMCGTRGRFRPAHGGPHMATPHAALEIRDARKRFGPTVALDGMSLSLVEGELLGLLGPNGAGKTTLIRAIAGRLKLDAGTITLFGEPLLPGRPRRDLGVVPQENALYPLLTARENLETFGRLLGLDGKRLRERCAWALEWTGLADRARTRVGQFSGGMKRRLNLACGVLHEPRLVLLDEPTVAVDPQSREKIHDMLAALRAAGASLLLSTHYLGEAEARCERIVVVDHGRTVAAGTLPELVQAAGLRGRHVRLTTVGLVNA